MKRVIFIITLIISLIISSINCFAAESNNNIFPKSNSEEIKQIQNTIVESGETTVLVLADEEIGPQISEDYVITLNDIPKENLTKLYSYTELLGIETLNEDSFKSNLENAECYYIAMTDVDGNSFFEQFEPQRVVTDKETEIYDNSVTRDYSESYAEKYISNAAHITYGIVNYNEAIDKALEDNKIENANVYLMYDYDIFMRRVLAVCFPEGKEPVILVFEMKVRDDLSGTDIIATPLSLAEFQDAELEKVSDFDGYGGTIKKSAVYGRYAAIGGGAILIIALIVLLTVLITKKRNFKSN